MRGKRGVLVRAGEHSQLPLDHPRPRRRTLACGTIPLAITPTTAEGLHRAARAAGGTLSHALTAAYAWWLHLYTDSTDVVFGSAHDLRSRDGRPAVAGNWMAPVVLRCRVSGQEPFGALVSRMRRVVTEALPRKSRALPHSVAIYALADDAA